MARRAGDLREVGAEICVVAILGLTYAMYRETAGYASPLPALFPRLVLAASAGLCLGFLGIRVAQRFVLRRKPGPARPAVPEEAADLNPARLGLFSVASGVYLLAIPRLGFYVSTVLYTLLLPAGIAWCAGGRRAVSGLSLIIAALATAGVIYLLMTVFLGFRFPRGIAV